MIETDYIILKKIPFRESSLIVSGISPELGKLDFVMRGHASGKAGKFPVAGLFRELHIEFKSKSDDLSGLLTAGKMELKANNDSIAENIPGYLAACELSTMLLANTAPMIPIPETYQGLNLFLKSIQSGKAPEPYLSLVYLMLLREGGELPPQEGRAGDFLDQLLSATAAGHDIPERLPESYWQKLSEWRKIICRKMKK